MISHLLPTSSSGNGEQLGRALHMSKEIHSARNTKTAADNLTSSLQSEKTNLPRDDIHAGLPGTYHRISDSTIQIPEQSLQVLEGSSCLYWIPR